MFKGAPTFKKSENLYPPGPNTKVLVWYPIGVMKLAEEANIMENTNGSGRVPRASAILKDMGSMSTPVALLDIREVRIVVAKYRPDKTAVGPRC